MTKELNFAFVNQYEELTTEEAMNVIGGDWWGDFVNGFFNGLSDALV